MRRDIELAPEKACKMTGTHVDGLRNIIQADFLKKMLGDVLERFVNNRVQGNRLSFSSLDKRRQQLDNRQVHLKVINRFAAQKLENRIHLIGENGLPADIHVGFTQCVQAVEEKLAIIAIDVNPAEMDFAARSIMVRLFTIDQLNTASREHRCLTPVGQFKMSTVDHEENDCIKVILTDLIRFDAMIFTTERGVNQAWRPKAAGSWK